MSGDKDAKMRKLRATLNARISELHESLAQANHLLEETNRLLAESQRVCAHCEQKAQQVRSSAPSDANERRPQRRG